jgi:hypothetical protein
MYGRTPERTAETYGSAVSLPELDCDRDSKELVKNQPVAFEV